MSKLQDAYANELTAERVKKMRDEIGEGMVTCKEIIQREIRLRLCAEAETVEDLKEILFDMLLKNRTL